MSLAEQERAAAIITIDRRRFLFAAGGLALGAVATPLLGAGPATAAPAAEGLLSAYVQITRSGDVFIVTPGAEMGQGISNGLPKIVAEELDADWSRVTIRLSEANPLFRSPKNNRQRSANSDGVTSYYDAMRTVGAGARAMLVAAAAARWGVDPASVTTREGRLLHAASGRSLGYGDVAEAAAKLSPPAQVALKDARDFRLIGRNFPRKDIPPKVDGTALFGMDLELPGMLRAVIRHVPVAGAKLGPVDPAPALKVPGVKRVVTLANAVAVVADHYWPAKKGAEALALTAVDGGALDSETLRRTIRAALDKDDAALPFPVALPPHLDMGASLADIDAAIAAAPIKLEAEYEVPYLAHAAMEPLCATALIEGDRCEVWAPSQTADAAVNDIVKLTGFPEANIRFNRTFLGGGFGRKNERDFMLQAVEVAKAVPGRPVMLIWPRDEDMKNDYYRPAFFNRVKAGVEQDGRIAAIRSRIAGQALSTSAAFRRPGMADGACAGDLIPEIYRKGLARIEHVETQSPLRCGYWRSVAGSQNGFFGESIVNEIAAALKRDPLDYRLSLVDHDRRATAALTTVAEKSGWRTALPKGRGRGVGLSVAWGSVCAQVVEVSVTGKTVKVERITVAFDCGQQIDPDNIVAQMEGGTIFGLSAALFGQITLKEGAVQEGGYNDYPVVLFASQPRVEVHLVASDAPPGGIGEAGVPAVAPALMAAIHQAAGTRLRRLPLVANGWEVAA